MSPVTRLHHAAAAAALAALAASASSFAQAPRPDLAPGVEAAGDFAAPQGPYVVTNGTPLYRQPVYRMGTETGVTLRRGERPTVLAEAQGGFWLLVGQGGKGVGYAPRSMLCPVNLCPDIKAAGPGG